MTSERDIAERFARETAEHEMTIRHDDGLYRHLRFKRPDRGSYWFDLVTWPGSLAIRGDVDGGYIFTRTSDMFEFFRTDQGRINPHYWAEKTEGGRNACKSYSVEQFRRQVAEYLEAHQEDVAFERVVAKAQELGIKGGDPELPKAAADECSQETAAYMSALREAMEKAFYGIWADYDVDVEDGAHRALNSFQFYQNPDDERVPDKGPDFEFYDTWEWDLRDYDWHFLWCCHAIVWGIAQYDAKKAAEQPAIQAGAVTA